MPRQHRAVLCVVIGLAVVAAAAVLVRRVGVERGNRTVGITVDYAFLVELGALSGIDTVDALKRMKSAGATHVMIREQCVGDLIDEHKVQLYEGDDFALLVPAPSVRDRVLNQLGARIPRGQPYSGPSANLKVDMADYASLPAGPGLVYDNIGTLDLLRPMGVGYRENAVADARAAGLQIVARPIAEMALTKEAINASLEALTDIGCTLVVFSGIEVYGVHDLVTYAAKQMEQRGIRFGYIEMAKQFGDAKMAGAMKCRIVRCHALAQAEMIKVPPERAVERFLKAVRERNVRLCYLRPYDRAAENPITAAEQYVNSACREMEKAGFALGEPEVYPLTSVSKPALIVLLAGIGAALIWLVGLFYPLSSRLFWGLLAADVVLAAGAAVATRGLATAAGPLGAAVLFPILAMSRLRIPSGSREPSLWRGITLFLGVSAVSALGGLLAAACISDLPHMMQIAAFRGVKLAQIVPLLAVALVFIARGTEAYRKVEAETDKDAGEWPALRAGALDVGQALVRYWHVGLIVLGLAAAAVMLMRSGNVSALPPSELELAVRSFLDKLLLVRPRTKEILVGHPLMIVSLALLLAGWRRGLWIGMVAGAIGQVSLVNTFGHIHTPLLLTVMRVCNGLWVGALLGIALFCVLRPLIRRLQPLESSPGQSSAET